jgi:hypothetical protein
MVYQRSLRKGLVILGLLGFLGLSACGGQAPSSFTPDVSNTQQSGLSLDNVVLAQPSHNQSQNQNQKLQPVVDATFERGSQVYIVLVNVAGLDKGADGKNKIDLELQLQAPNGQMVYSRQGLLRATGHQDLPGNRAKTPYAALATAKNWLPGTYTLTFTLRDLVGKGYITAKREIRLK